MKNDTYLIKEETLTDIADAIREKKQSEDTIAVSDFADEIENLPGKEDLSEYFVTEVTINTNKPLNPIKKYADVFVADNVTNISSLFATQFLSSMAPKVIANSNITNISWLFNNTQNIETVDLTGLDTRNVTNMQGLFHYTLSTYNDTKLKTINFGNNFNTKKVTSMRNMFSGRRGVTNLDLSSFETPVLTDTFEMFNYCGVAFIDMRNFDFTNLTNYTRMFSGTGFRNSCEIIVKDQTQKDWVMDKFPNLTNVKTVAEYEVE